MQYIGKIDIEKYQPITKYNIITDDVVLTEDRKQHIITRRGQDFYDRYSPFFEQIITDPDYIFKDRNDNTALVSKTVVENGVNVILVLRLIVAGENPNYKNSIITAIKESDRRFAQKLRNSDPIYKKLDKSE